MSQNSQKYYIAVRTVNTGHIIHDLFVITKNKYKAKYANNFNVRLF